MFAEIRESVLLNHNHVILWIYFEVQYFKSMQGCKAVFTTQARSNLPVWGQHFESKL